MSITALPLFFGVITGILVGFCVWVHSVRQPLEARFLKRHMVREKIYNHYLAREVKQPVVVYHIGGPKSVENL